MHHYYARFVSTPRYHLLQRMPRSHIDRWQFSLKLHNHHYDKREALIMRSLRRGD